MLGVNWVRTSGPPTGGRQTARLARPSWLMDGVCGTVEDLLLDVDVRGDCEGEEAVRGGVGGRALSNDRKSDKPVPSVVPSPSLGEGSGEFNLYSPPAGRTCRVVSVVVSVVVVMT